VLTEGDTLTAAISFAVGYGCKGHSSPVVLPSNLVVYPAVGSAPKAIEGD